MQIATLQLLLDKILEHSARRMLAIVLVAQLFIIGILAIFYVHPSLKKIKSLNNNVLKALESRNESLVVSALERSAEEGQRVMRGAELSLSAILQELANKENGQKMIAPPIGKDFEPEGKFSHLLTNNLQYENPVSFDLPRTIIRSENDRIYFSKIWKSFLSIASRYFEQSPGIKWIYMGTSSGSFMLYPANSVIPDDYSPHVRP
ncbi:MAG: hypothetical protein HY747_06205, partial [Elusimicrobia bacterium]|nr:hypothetical protein [Elusimicrobiota bacterium]